MRNKTASPEKSQSDKAEQAKAYRSTYLGNAPGDGFEKNVGPALKSDKYEDVAILLDTPDIRILATCTFPE